VVWEILISAVLLNAIAQLMLKAATIRLGTLWPAENDLPYNASRITLQPFILGGLACYAVSAVLWIVVLSRAPVGAAYPMFSIGYIFNAIAAYLLFHEILSATQIIWIVVIIVGVVLITPHG
jgi:multidrug transporter EmrE-like cation transporter